MLCAFFLWANFTFHPLLHRRDLRRPLFVVGSHLFWWACCYNYCILSFLSNWDPPLLTFFFFIVYLLIISHPNEGVSMVVWGFLSFVSWVAKLLYGFQIIFEFRLFKEYFTNPPINLLILFYIILFYISIHAAKI